MRLQRVFYDFPKPTLNYSYDVNECRIPQRAWRAMTPDRSYRLGSSTYLANHTRHSLKVWKTTQTKNNNILITFSLVEVLFLQVQTVNVNLVRCATLAINNNGHNFSLRSIVWRCKYPWTQTYEVPFVHSQKEINLAAFVTHRSRSQITNEAMQNWLQTTLCFST